MATPPFAAPLEASLKLPIQGGRMELLSGLVVYPQYFCCTTCTNVGVPKAPVALIKAFDVYACLDAAVCVDILGSWSPTSTLASYNVDWDDGNNSPGAWPPAGDICHPLGGYAVADIYDVTLTVTDMLGTTGTSIVQIEVMECGCDPKPASIILVGSYGAGPFYTEALVGGATVWNGLDIASLIPAGSQRCNVLTEYHWSDGTISIFMGTGCGIYEYVVPAGDPYGGTWNYLLDPVDMLGAVGINGTFDVWDIQMSMENEGWGYCVYGVLNWPNMWGVVAHTRDGWQTIHTASIVRADRGSNIRSEIAIAQHSSGEVVYVGLQAWPADGGDRLYRSINHAVTWSQIDAGAGTDEMTVHVPWHSPSWTDSTIYWGGNGSVRRSVNSGATFAGIGNMGRVARMYGPTYNRDRLWGSNWTPGGWARYWDPVGGFNDFGPALQPGAGHCMGGGPLTYDASCFPVTWLLVGDQGGGPRPGEIHVNLVGGLLSDSTGDWNAKTGAVRALCMLHRTPEPLVFGDP